MPNMNLTSINIILDRSGSMNSVRDDVIGGFNVMLAEQKRHPSDARFTLAQFDDEYEVVHNNISLGDVPELTEQTFVPRGSTALLDAIGRTLNVTRAELKKLPESTRPGKVIFVVFTDGMENASHEFSKAQVTKLVDECKTQDEWEFVFIGADLESFAEAHALGVATNGKMMRARKTSRGIREAYEGTSRGLMDYRSKPDPRGFEFVDQSDES